MNIKQILTQSLLIVFSVVLGLYLSERIEERKKKNESKVLLAKIKAEVQDNIRILEEYAPYHQEISKNLHTLSQDDAFVQAFIDNQYVLMDTLFTRGNFMGLFPANDAWEIAKAHPLMVNIDYDQLLILSRIYNQQANTFEPGMKMFELLNSTHVNTPEDAVGNLELLSNRMHELVSREQDLLYFYKKGEAILSLKEDMEMVN